LNRSSTDLRRCGLLRDDDKILWQEGHESCDMPTSFSTIDRAAALKPYTATLMSWGSPYCGRYGEWGLMWTDESFARAANKRQNALCMQRLVEPSSSSIDYSFLHRDVGREQGRRDEPWKCGDRVSVAAFPSRWTVRWHRYAHNSLGDAFCDSIFSPMLKSNAIGPTASPPRYEDREKNAIDASSCRRQALLI